MRPALAVLLLPFAAGCLNLAKDYPERHLHAVTAERPGDPASGGQGRVLAVRPFSISKRFETPEFVYRKGETEWETDYYNAFFVSPKDMVTDAARGWVAEAGLYEHVGSASSAVPPTHILEGHVAEIWVDARGQGLKAVLSVQVMVADDRETPAKVLLARTYSGSSAMSGDTPEAAVKGWSEVLRDILGRLEADLKGVASGR